MSEWLSVEITLEAAQEIQVELFTGALFECGVSGTEIRDTGPDVIVIASFSPEIPADDIEGIVDQC